ncbi:MAG: hypothetical protein FJ272_02005 [Planctomycetes bacterium]|nr:hypothetical protein [Planctomycetota bacterium]
MTPRNDLASTQYCLADPGKEYLVYLPEGGEVTVDLTAASRTLAVEWFNPRTGAAVGRRHQQSHTCTSVRFRVPAAQSLGIAHMRRCAIRSPCRQRGCARIL